MPNLTLLKELSTVEFLNSAWDQLNKSNENSYGISGESIKSFKDNKFEKLKSISNQLIGGKYKFSPNRPVVIPKDNGKPRPLQIPEISDRVVLKAIAILIENYLNPILKVGKDVSFAYQKKLGVKDAIEKIKEYYKDGNRYIFETDIKDFFPSVNRERLLKEQVFPILPDETINNLIFNALNQGVSGLERLPSNHQKLYKNVGDGIPQGNALSPLLSNVYLSPFDDYMKKNGFKLVRYADDFVVLCQTVEEAQNCHKLSSEFLNDNLKLSIHEISSEKTNILDPSEKTFSFLSIVFDGEKTYPSSKNIENFKSRLKKKLYANDPNVLDVLMKIQNALDGWVSAFFHTELEVCEEEIDLFINRQLYLYLGHKNWKLKNHSQLPFEYRKKGESVHCLSLIQRKNSGVTLCIELAKQKREAYSESQQEE